MGSLVRLWIFGLLGGSRLGFGGYVMFFLALDAFWASFAAFEAGFLARQDISSVHVFFTLAYMSQDLIQYTFKNIVVHNSHHSYSNLIFAFQEKRRIKWRRVGPSHFWKMPPANQATN